MMLASPGCHASSRLLGWAAVANLINRAFLREEGLVLFSVLTVSQIGHFFEHVAQMVQIHVLGLTGLAARGVVSVLDVEWVHFAWNTWVMVAVALLLIRFLDNRWLWLSAGLAGWHAIEHVYILSVYLSTGVAGTPGLLSVGGVIGGGLPVSRPDLHFFYNLAETMPLCVALVWQRRTLAARQVIAPRKLRVGVHLARAVALPVPLDHAARLVADGIPLASS